MLLIAKSDSLQFAAEVCTMASGGRTSITKTLSSQHFVWLLFLCVTKCFGPNSAQNFSVSRTSYDCTSNVICLGGAHVYDARETSKLQVGMLSLIAEDPDKATQSTGMVYYNERVRLLDPLSSQSASFSTSFVIEVVNNTARNGNGPADGMAFVISADNSTLGNYGRTLGIFNAAGFTPFKTIVVEFDEYKNYRWPVLDKNDNHVSFDFSNISAIISAEASTAGVDLGDGQRTYGWVEYSSDTQRLELRISNSNSKPTKPLLNYTVDLFDVAEEYMWIGFTSGASFIYSNYYIGEWTFNSSGIPAASPSSPVPMPGPGSYLGPGGKKHYTNWTVLGISVGVNAFLLVGIFITILVVALVYCRGGGRGWMKFAERDPSMQLEGMLESMSYDQLSMATGGFSKESQLGRGGFGSVYKGVLPSSGIPVAVKKIGEHSTQGVKEFMAEVSIISQIRHRNLIHLLGWCKDELRGNYLLVYELMPNGSLDKVLFGPFARGTAGLSWPQRYNIVRGTAAALEYLHQGWKRQVIHRDIKASNIMLDENWDAKLGDFGLARLVDHEREAPTTLVAGTHGYMAPEIVAGSGRFTEKTDVFAFGAVVLEVACGRKAGSVHLSPDEMSLVDWVWHSLSEGDLLSTVDKRLDDFDPSCMEVLLSVGLLCSHPNPLARPSMRHVVQILTGEVPLPPVPPSKPVLVFSSDYQSASNDDLMDRRKKGHKSSFRSMSVSLVSESCTDSIGASSEQLPVTVTI